MERTAYQIFQQWEPLVLFGLNVFILYWFYRIWKKTGETAYFWLMAGLGGAPLAQSAVRGLYRLFTTTFPQTPISIVAVKNVLWFSDLIVICLGLGCVVVGLGKMHNGAIPLRRLFSCDVGNSSKEEVS